MISRAARAPVPVRDLTFAGVVRSEWVKLWSLRSPLWLLATLAFLPPVMAMVRAAAAAPVWEATQQAGAVAATEAVAIGALPIGFVAAVLGLVAMGSEYTDESLAVTFIASPRRRLVIIAKCFPVGVASFFAAIFGLALAAALAIPILGARGYHLFPWGQLLGIVVAGALATALLAVFGVACAALSRTVTGAAVHLACVLVVVPSVVGLLGGRTQLVSDLLPATAVQVIVTRHPATPFIIGGALPSTLAWWGGVAVLLGWAAVYLCVALARITRRTVAPAQRRGRQGSAPARTTSIREPRGATFTGLLRSEALKLATLPAAWWLLGISAVAIVILAVVSATTVSAVGVAGDSTAPRDILSATIEVQNQTIAVGLGLAQVLIAFLGAIVFTSEFTSGNILPTLFAVPRRSRLVLAKVAVVAAATVVVSLVAFVLAAVLVTPVQQQMGFDVSLGAPIVVTTVLRCVLALTLMSILGCAIGVLFRGAIASVSVVVSILILSHSVLGPMQAATRGTPFVWLANLNEFLPQPSIAVQQVPANAYWPYLLLGDVLQLDPDQVMLVVIAWALGTLAISMVVFARRSA